MLPDLHLNPKEKKLQSPPFPKKGKGKKGKKGGNDYTLHKSPSTYGRLLFAHRGESCPNPPHVRIQGGKGGGKREIFAIPPAKLNLRKEKKKTEEGEKRDISGGIDEE